MADYRWETIVFTGVDAAEATAAFNDWFGVYAPSSGMGARRDVREMANGALYYHLTAIVPASGGYELHVTALVQADEG